MPQYSRTTAPLRQLLNKDEPWNWTAECSEAVRLLSASGSGHKPLLLHRWCERQYDCQLKFMPGRDNVVADHLSRSIAAPAPAASPSSHDVEPELIQMLHAPLQYAVSLEELQDESEHYSMLTTLHTYISSGWPE